MFQTLKVQPILFNHQINRLVIKRLTSYQLAVACNCLPEEPEIAVDANNEANSNAHSAKMMRVFYLRLESCPSI
jgi:hypothetical protein